MTAKHLEIGLTTKKIQAYWDLKNAVLKVKTYIKQLLHPSAFSSTCLQLSLNWFFQTIKLCERWDKF